MSPETDLRDRLERELEHLPAVPAQAYLREGRRAGRRRWLAALRTVLGEPIGVD